MAEVNIDVAKEASVQAVNTTVGAVNTSVQAVNTKVGTSGDTASNTPTTLFAGIKGLIAWFTGTWTAARAAKLDNIQATLNTPDGNTLGTWIQAMQNASNTAVNLLNSSTYGLSALKTAVTGGSVPVVKSIQKGVIATPTETAYSITVSISSINASKSMAILNTAHNTDSAVWNATLSSLTNTSLTVVPSSGGAAWTSASRLTISWQVVEFY